jgi:hypothetical protein
LKQVPSQAPPDEIFLLVVGHQGGEHAVPAIEGRRGMEVIDDGGIDLATHGRACAGCHVYHRPWLERLPAVGEEDRLYAAFGVNPPLAEARGFCPPH